MPSCIFRTLTKFHEDPPSPFRRFGLLLTLVLIGFILIPVMALVSVVPFVHAGYAAYRVSQGDDYRYPFAADLVDER